ncbi:type VI secretion system tube protein Hcp [Sphingomonas sp. 1P06PA]|uniref:Hcp family type VI secretion system effector n=1 Tax=Sphingomonas sp. 1P06PA TaxID=554121 RepID=UPI0039A40586
MAADMFLKLEGIKGESTDKAHKEWIDILSFSFGVSQSGTASMGGGAGAGKASFQDLSITKRADASTPMLMLNCAAGTHIKQADLVVRKAGGNQEEYYKVKMTNLLVSSFQNGGSDGDSVPIETLSMNYSKIEFEYRPQTEQGTLGPPSKAGWDLKQNVKV